MSSQQYKLTNPLLVPSNGINHTITSLEHNNGIDLEKQRAENLNPAERIEVFGMDLSSLPELWQFIVCVFGTFLAYIIYGYAQESIVSKDFQYGLFLTLIQFFFYSFLAYLENLFSASHEPRRIPMRSYFILATLQLLSMGLSNVSASYLNYPLKVLLKSSKIIPVMFVGFCFLGSRYKNHEYVATFFLIFGICIYTWADSQFHNPDHDNPNSVIGFMLMSGSLLADGYLGSFQERLLKEHNALQREMLMYSCFMGGVFLFIVLLLNGEFWEAMQYCAQVPNISMAIVVFSVTGYFGSSCVLALIKRFGVFLATTVTTVRKIFTLICSYIFFPKPFTFFHLFATCFAFIGMFIHIYYKNVGAVKTLLYKISLHESRPSHTNDQDSKD